MFFTKSYFRKAWSLTVPTADRREDRPAQAHRSSPHLKSSFARTPLTRKLPGSFAPPLQVVPTTCRPKQARLICTYVSMYVCTYVHTYIRTYVRTYVRATSQSSHLSCSATLMRTQSQITIFATTFYDRESGRRHFYERAYVTAFLKR